MAIQPKPPKTAKIKEVGGEKGQKNDAVAQDAKEYYSRVAEPTRVSPRHPHSFEVFFEFNLLIEKLRDKKTLINDRGVN